jgi:CRISPR-associated endonuclease Cas2
MKYVIAFDVREDKGRRGLVKQLELMGFRRQKSVFEGDFSPSDIDALLDGLAVFIEPQHDSLTAWPTAENGTAQIVHRGSPRAVVERDWLIL